MTKPMPSFIVRRCRCGRSFVIDREKKRTKCLGCKRKYDAEWRKKRRLGNE